MTTNLDPNWRAVRVKATVLDYKHVNYTGDAAPRNEPALPQAHTRIRMRWEDAR